MRVSPRGLVARHVLADEQPRAAVKSPPTPPPRSDAVWLSAAAGVAPQPV